MSRQRADEAYEAMARTIVEDNLAFVAFDRPRMREFLHIVNPAFTPPCSRTLVDKYVPRVLNSVEEAVKKELNSATSPSPPTAGRKAECI